MPYNVGDWVMHGDQIAIVFAVAANGYVLHAVDHKGETKMRPAEAHESRDPATGNARREVTHEVIATDADLRPATEREIPKSRRYVPEEV